MHPEFPTWDKMAEQEECRNRGRSGAIPPSPERRRRRQTSFQALIGGKVCPTRGNLRPQHPDAATSRKLSGHIKSATYSVRDKDTERGIVNYSVGEKVGRKPM